MDGKNRQKEAEYYKLKRVMEVFVLETQEDRDKAKQELLSKGFSGKLIDKYYGTLSSPNNKNSVFTRQGQAEEFIRRQPLFYDNSRIWWKWDKEEKYWQMVDETDILNMVSDELDLDVVPSKTKTEIITALELVGRRNIPEFSSQGLIQFRNGIIALERPESLMDPNPEYFITNPIPWNYGDSEKTPKMDNIFEEWVGKDYVKMLYEILSYCLLPQYPIHRVFCLIGEGMNGKSCFLNLLRKFVGDKNVTSTELDTLLTSRFEISRVHKKLVCQMGETNFSEISKTSILKKLSGEDLIGFEYKRKDPFVDKNYAKIIIATNNLPSTTDKTIGFYRRWSIIDFSNRFSEKKDILEDIPDKEYENLCRKSIRILNELLIKREFTNEGTIEERTEKYEARSNFLEKFLHEFTEEGYDSYITKSDFYKRFVAWCKENRHRQMSEINVSRGMKKLGIDDDKKYFHWLYDGKGGQARVWVNLIWK